MSWNLQEWLVLIVCFLGLILARIFLFKKSYANKVKYYSDPYELAQLVIDHKKRNLTAKDIVQDPYKIESLIQLLDYNLSQAVIYSKHEFIQKDKLCEKLKQSTMYIALTKIIYQKKSKQMLSENLTKLANVVGPAMDSLKKNKGYRGQRPK